MSQWRPQVLTASRLQALWILSLRRLGSDGFKVIEPTNMEWRKINKKKTEKRRFWFRNFNSMFFNMFLFDMCWYLLIFIALILIDICWHVLIVVDIYWYLLIFIDSLLYSLKFIGCLVCLVGGCFVIICKGSFWIFLLDVWLSFKDSMAENGWTFPNPTDYNISHFNEFQWID